MYLSLVFCCAPIFINQSKSVYNNSILCSAVNLTQRVFVKKVVVQKRKKIDIITTFLFYLFLREFDVLIHRINFKCVRAACLRRLSYARRGEITQRQNNIDR